MGSPSHPFLCVDTGMDVPHSNPREVGDGDGGGCCPGRCSWILVYHVNPTRGSFVIVLHPFTLLSFLSVSCHTDVRPMTTPVDPEVGWPPESPSDASKMYEILTDRFPLRSDKWRYRTESNDPTIEGSWTPETSDSYETTGLLRESLSVSTNNRTYPWPMSTGGLIRWSSTRPVVVANVSLVLIDHLCTSLGSRWERTLRPLK